MTSTVIGIDLGTTNTCVAVVKNNRVEIVINEEGSRTFPSVVCFADEEVAVGHSANYIAHKYLDKTIYDIKRIIGYKYSDKVTQDEIAKFSFKVVDRNDQPAIQIPKGEETIYYSPEQISGIILKYAKELAEKYLGFPVTGAVITVPAYFNHLQRSATRDAAKFADLEVLKIINEPTAAAIAFGVENQDYVEKTVLIYDLGGGTFDISIVKIKESTYDVLATSGDTHLGGVDFDNNIVNHLAEYCKIQHKVDMREDNVKLRRLRNICENQKRKLSFTSRVNIELIAVVKECDIDIQFSRTQFEEINLKLFRKTIDTIESCLKDADLAKSDIDDIILIGGSTRIPKIQELLSNYFDKKKILRNINPDEAVAFGAAIQAAVTEGKTEAFQTIKITDVISLSIGQRLEGDLMGFVIRRNTKIPHKVTKEYCTLQDDQPSVLTEIYQGERLYALENKYLGSFSIGNLPKSPAGEVRILDTFSLDENGILQVHSVVKGTDLKGNIEIKLLDNKFPPRQINRIVNEAQKKSIDDKHRVRVNKAKYELESYCRRTKQRVQQNIRLLRSADGTCIIDCCNEGLVKANEFKFAFEMEDLLEEITSICDPMMAEV